MVRKCNFYKYWLSDSHHITNRRYYLKIDMKVHIPSTLWIILVEFDLVFVASNQATVKSLYYGKSLILCFVTFPVFFLIHFNNLYFSQETFLLNDVLIINSLIFFGLVRFYTLLVIFWLKLYRTFLWNDSTLVSFMFNKNFKANLLMNKKL